MGLDLTGGSVNPPLRTILVAVGIRPKTTDDNYKYMVCYEDICSRLGWGHNTMVCYTYDLTNAVLCVCQIGGGGGGGGESGGEVDIVVLTLHIKYTFEPTVVHNCHSFYYFCRCQYFAEFSQSRAIFVELNQLRQFMK